MNRFRLPTFRALFFLLIFFFSSSLCAKEEKNQILVCDNGLEMFHWDLDFVRSAEQSVEILACFFGGDIAQKLLHEIEKRLSEVPDLQVYLLASSTMLQPEDWRRMQKLKAAFPNNFHFEFSTQVARFLPELVSIDNHVKLFVVDGTYFSWGGTNLEERHCCDGSINPGKVTKGDKLDNVLPSAMRDQDIVGKGPFAKELRRVFFQLYALWAHYNCTGLLEVDPEKNKSSFFEPHAACSVKHFDSSPNLREVAGNKMKLFLGGPHQNENAITKEYIRLIQEAKEEIILEHLYFLPIDSILDALKEAVNRGVKLTVITNGLDESETNGSCLFCWGNRMAYLPLFYGRDFRYWEAGAAAACSTKKTEIYEYCLKNVWLHKKIMLVDRKKCVIGSYNFSIKSAFGDYELIVVMDSPEVTKDLLKVHDKDLLFSRKISPELAHSWYFDPVLSYIGFIQKKFSGFL